MKIQGTPNFMPIESTSSAQRSTRGSNEHSAGAAQAATNVQLSSGTSSFIQSLQIEASQQEGIRADVVAEMREAVNNGDLIARTDINAVIDSLLADL